MNSKAKEPIETGWPPMEPTPETKASRRPVVLSGGLEPVLVLLGVGEAERVLRREVGVELLEGAGVEQQVEAAPDRQHLVVAAERADVPVLLEVGLVDDLGAAVALVPDPLALLGGDGLGLDGAALRLELLFLREPGHGCGAPRCGRAGAAERPRPGLFTPGSGVGETGQHGRRLDGARHGALAGGLGRSPWVPAYAPPKRCIALLGMALSVFIRSVAVRHRPPHRPRGTVPGGLPGPGDLPLDRAPGRPQSRPR